MPISHPKATSSYPDGNYYPSNSIVFDIKNDNGAKVSVIGNKNDISIYKFRTDRAGDPTKLYTMKSVNTEELDSHRYFTYDYTDGHNGATGTLATPYAENLMGDGGALYAHIFKLPKLPEGWAYAIGSAAGNTRDGSNDAQKANLYYLAVQGQTDGTIGSSVAKVGNVLEDVDFLINAPVKSDYVVTNTEIAGEPVTQITFNSSKLAYFNFTSNFNTTSGTFTVGTQEVEIDGVGHTLLNLQYNNDPQFITYLFAYDYKAEPAFCIKGLKYETGASPTYTIIRS